MKKILQSAFLLAGAILLLAGCGKKDKTVYVTGIKLSESSVSVLVGESLQLSATISPSDATDKSVTWSSTNESVATVDKDGRVTGITEGISTVKAVTTDGAFSAECLVNVSYVHDSSVSLNLTEDQVILIGDKLEITATVAPADAVDVTVKWECDDPETVSLTPGEVNGNVAKATLEALKGGTVTIKVTTNDQGNTATLKVTVKGSSAQAGGTFGEEDFGQYE